MTTENTDHQSFQDEAKRETNLLVAISRAIEASPVKHQDDRETAVRAVLAKLQSTHTLRVGDRGWVTALDRSGNAADFAKLVTDVMLLDPKIGDPASITAAVKAGTLSLGAKSELTTPAQKIEFINKYGLEAWEKLPVHRTGSAATASKEMTKAQYMAMSVRDRMAFQQTISEQELGSILSRR